VFNLQSLYRTPTPPEFIPLCLQSLPIRCGQALGLVESEPLHFEVAAAVDKKVVMSVSFSEGYAPGPAWVPTDASDAAGEF